MVSILPTEYIEYVTVDPAGTWVPSGRTSSEMTYLKSSGTDGYSLNVSANAAFKYVNLSASSNTNGSSTQARGSLPRVWVKTVVISVMIFSSTRLSFMTSQKNQLIATDDVSRPASTKFSAIRLRTELGK
ncbi:hypothetical protein RHMOL_Rhmol01G0319500 [Rhododendron molle]|uniref:Uncharacterized protein n=1 Tax=Rhododendron molle TaxID=49168 RepID=A0ACC0Q9P7_RHOML|nr:hypothetical protein RHMOL_Rhmol01G0319500 [Rhododendron molle]